MLTTSAVAARAQRGQQRLGDPQQAEHVDVVHPRPVLDVGLGHGSAASNAPPALLTSTSSRGPTAAASAATDGGVGDVAGHRRGRRSPAASGSIRSARRAAQTTWKPSAASARAVAAPIPLLAPVTTAVRGHRTSWAQRVGLGTATSRSPVSD